MHVFGNYVHLCRRHGRRSRFVPTKCPRVGYFTDSTSMSGAATDVSTNDASDEDSNVEGVYIILALAYFTACTVAVCMWPNNYTVWCPCTQHLVSSNIEHSHSKHVK